MDEKTIQSRHTQRKGKITGISTTGSYLYGERLIRPDGEAFIENARLGALITDEKGFFIYINHAFARTFGYDSVQSFLDNVPNIEMLYADVSDRGKLLSDADKKGSFDDVVLTFKRSGGQIIWLSLNGRVSTGKNGQKTYECFAIDITDKKNATQALYESETHFRQLISQASEAFFIHDFKGYILDVNQQACLSLGYNQDELMGMNLMDIDIEIRDKEHRTTYWETLRPREYTTFEGLHMKKDGATFPVEVRLGRVDLKDGRVLLSFVRDITERIRKDRELKKAFTKIKGLKEQLEKENTYLRRKVTLKYRHREIIGESDSIKKMLNLAEKVACQDTCVLITGETGTGKELLAHAIHNMSKRNNRPMITVNCAALPVTLIESELFGREKGAYTGALSKRTGRFEAADQSTIFLDEIGELPLELQVKLLRVLQEGQFERLGSSQTKTVNVRVVAATNCDLKKMIKEGTFRKDLYYRLNVFPLTVPPLRSRKQDIPLLVWAFTNEFVKSMGKKITYISKATMAKLTRHPWPGNIRELKNVIERAMIISSDEKLEINGLETSEEIETSNAGVTLEEIEKKYILSVLKETGWRVSGKNGAALILGLKPTTLEARMKKLGIKRPS